MKEDITIMARTPRPGEFYKHFKDKLYQVLAVAEHTETGEALVVYQALYSDFRVYARPLPMFVSEVDHDKYPDVSQKYRFERVVLTPDGKAAVDERNDLTGLAANQKIVVGETANLTEPVVEQKISAEPEKSSSVNPLLVDFLEEDDYGIKLGIFASLRKTLTQKEADVLCEVLDMPPQKGNLQSQAAAIESYLKMQQKFNGTRLR